MADDSVSATQRLDTTCCVTGGGPAGMILGYLLARAGIDVVVLEKHADFLRDFRGDTIHPSTLEIMHELGILEEFLKLPHTKATLLHGLIGDDDIPVADFSHLPTRCKFIAFMPQWDFLDFIAAHANRLPKFRLVLRAEVTDLLEENGRVVGVHAKTPDGPLDVRALLTVGADGRHSTVRARAGFEVQDIGAPIDVLWMRMSWKEGDPKEFMGRFDQGLIFILLYRGEYWQFAYVISKGGYDEVRKRGLEAFRHDIVQALPFLADRVHELQDWEQVKLLTVTVDRLRQWAKPGLLCIGDAAHAMSPIGGVGINLAIQDAVATANLLTQPLLDGNVTLEDLRKVQGRRTFPTRLTQGVQVLIQNRVIGRILGTHKKLTPPWQLRLLRRWPALCGIPGRAIGLGVRPEHVRTKAARESG